jgi:single-strand DNA-binding protein
MSLFINNVQLAGNLTRDPQIRFLANETAVADFGLAINRRYRTKDGAQKEDTTFVDVECWGRTAELVGQYLTKGRNCFIEGSLKLDQWEAQDGSKRSKIRVRADRVHFIGIGSGRSDGNDDDRHAASCAPPESHVPPPSNLGDDEPPF